jgi:hypothetical protein
MPFIRRGLGSRLRLRRIPEFHVRLDDTAERGTRILRLLDRIGAGESVEPDVPHGESLPTPVSRLPHEGDRPDEPPSAAEPLPGRIGPRARPARRGERRGTRR